MIHKERYTYEDFLEIIKALRAPDGCPWDREQTHESLRPCMLEEAYEFLSSVRILEETGSADNMCEELGDLLLQIVMHAEIAGEEGRFTMEDVVNEISRKMVRRHPHVFGTVEVSGVSDVLNNWDDIKKKEKEGKTWIESPLREIPKEQPALTSSAAADGVGTRRSAAKSQMVKSISWPTALITGILLAAISRASISSLKHQRSSMLPPPRVTTMTSAEFVRLKNLTPAAICSAAPLP